MSRGRAFQIPADVVPTKAPKEPRTRAPTVSAVTLELSAHEPADMLAALIAGKESALAEATTWSAKGEEGRAQQARDRAERLERLLSRTASACSDFWSSR